MELLVFYLCLHLLNANTTSLVRKNKHHCEATSQPKGFIDFKIGSNYPASFSF